MHRDFNEIEPIIEQILLRYRGKWNLDVIKFYEFEDFKQDVKLHIYLKFDKWNQEEPFEPWCSRVIRNQLINKKRNLFTNHNKPCSDCYFNGGGDSCTFTKSRLQNEECGEYKKWAKAKKNAYEIKRAKDIDTNVHEINKPDESNIDYEKFIRAIRKEIDSRSTDIKYKINLTTLKIFDMSYMEKLDDEDIAKKLGYKTNESNRSPGYRNISLHRKVIKEVAKELLKREDFDFV